MPAKPQEGAERQPATLRGWALHAEDQNWFRLRRTHCFTPYLGTTSSIASSSRFSSLSLGYRAERALARRKNSGARPARGPQGQAPRRPVCRVQGDRGVGGEGAPGRLGRVAERDPVRPAARGGPPAPALLRTGRHRLPRGAGSATYLRGGPMGPPGDTGAPLPLSRARTRPGGSLGQRGDRMAPLRWGARDHPGAVSGADGNHHVRDAIHGSASKGGIYLDTAETAGSLLYEARGVRYLFHTSGNELIESSPHTVGRKAPQRSTPSPWSGPSRLPAFQLLSLHAFDGGLP
jgi:hypothetical protein